MKYLFLICFFFGSLNFLFEKAYGQNLSIFPIDKTGKMGFYSDNQYTRGGNINIKYTTTYRIGDSLIVVVKDINNKVVVKSKMKLSIDRLTGEISFKLNEAGNYNVVIINKKNVTNYNIYINSKDEDSDDENEVENPNGILDDTED